jgi:hypothetical protein
MTITQDKCSCGVDVLKLDRQRGGYIIVNVAPKRNGKVALMPDGLGYYCTSKPERAAEDNRRVLRSDADAVGAVRYEQHDDTCETAASVLADVAMAAAMGAGRR